MAPAEKVRTPFEVRKLAGALGAEILGIDLGASLDDGSVLALRRAWLDHGVIFFRDQKLNEGQFLALARRFGRPVEYPFIKGLA